MKILSIVIFNAYGKPTLSSPYQTFFSPKNKHEEIIKDKIIKLVQKTQQEQKELNRAPMKITINKDIFYAKCDKSEAVIIAVDSVMKPMQIDELCTTILKTKEQAKLDKILAAPEKYKYTKIDEIKKETYETKEVIFNSMEKIMERGEKIELLIPKTKHLDERAFTLKKRSNKLKTSFWCSSIFNCNPCCCDDSPAYYSFNP